MCFVTHRSQDHKEEGNSTKDKVNVYLCLNTPRSWVQQSLWVIEKTKLNTPIALYIKERKYYSFVFKCIRQRWERISELGIDRTGFRPKVSPVVQVVWSQTSSCCFSLIKFVPDDSQESLLPQLYLSSFIQYGTQAVIEDLISDLKELKYWVGQEICSGFSYNIHAKTQINCLANPIYYNNKTNLTLPILARISLTTLPWKKTKTCLKTE